MRKPASINLRSIEGFTLIELMVVVAIVSILATLALPRFERFQEKARLTEAIEMVSSIKESIELFRLEEGKTPLAAGARIGTSSINSLGLLVQIPDDTYFEYFISAGGSSIVPGSSSNLRVGARHPAGVTSTSIAATSINSNEEGTQFYKLKGSTEQIPY